MRSPSLLVGMDCKIKKNIFQVENVNEKYVTSLYFPFAGFESSQLKHLIDLGMAYSF